MNKSEAAAFLAGVKRVEGAEAKAPTNLHLISGEVVSASEDGGVLVQMDGIVFTGDEDEPYVEMETFGGLEEGDEVTILLSGEEGHGMSPLALGSVGSIDRINGRIKLIVDDLEANYITANEISAIYVTTDTLTANYLDTQTLSAQYAQINGANINTATIVDAWIDKLMVQSGLISHTGTIYELDAIRVNASSIKTGTLDVERLLVTVNGHKYLVQVDPNTGNPSYVKLDGDAIQDNTITAAKIVAEAITAEKITTENIVGSGGWINLRSGVFAYTNAQTGQGIAWDGQHLSIAGTVRIGTSDYALADLITTANNAAQRAETAAQEAHDVPIVTLSSTNGTVFKRNAGISTTIIATIFTPGGKIDNATDLVSRFGSGAYLEWGWRDVVTDADHVLLVTDPRIIMGGFGLVVSPEDIDSQAVITCSLNY